MVLRSLVAIAGSLALTVIGVAPAGAVSLQEACQRFEAKLKQAQASNDPAQVQKVYTKGAQRIASRFNGATCPGIKAP